MISSVSFSLCTSLPILDVDSTDEEGTGVDVAVVDETEPMGVVVGGANAVDMLPPLIVQKKKKGDERILRDIY